MKDTDTYVESRGDSALRTVHPPGEVASARIADARASAHEDGARSRLERAGARGRGLARCFAPPDIWAQRRPSLSEVVAYPRRGAWTSDEAKGLRLLALAYVCAIGVPVAAIAYIAAWVAERPSRAIATAVLAAVAAQIPALRAVAGVVLAPVFWLIP